MNNPAHTSLQPDRTPKRYPSRHVRLGRNHRNTTAVHRRGRAGVAAETAQRLQATLADLGTALDGAQLQAITLGELVDA